MIDTITCPNCAHTIHVGELLSKQAEQELQKRMAQEKGRFEQEVNQKRQEYRQAFENLDTQKRDVEQKRQALEQQIQQGIEQALQKERTQMQAQIQQEQARQLQAQKEEMEKKLQTKIEAEYELKLKEKEMQVEGLKKATQELQRKAQLASPQLQGEAQEIAIEEYLRQNFPLDSIEEVKKGRKGVDCVQTIHDYKLQNCGVICYESKRAKDFKEEWIEKFKQDMQEAQAHVGVLVTQVLPRSPKPMERMGLYQGVYICTFQEFKGLCGILRQMIIDRAWAQKSQENKGDKIHELYDYLMGSEFAQEVENAFLTFREMQADLEREKQAMEKLWARRSKQIEKIARITARTRGSIEGIAGSAIAPIKALELGIEKMALTEDAQP